MASCAASVSSSLRLALISITVASVTGRSCAYSPSSPPPASSRIGTSAPAASAAPAVSAKRSAAAARALAFSGRSCSR